MKIRRIKIDKYGPLADLDLKLVDGFQCICGPNESGKTLLVDALLKMFMGMNLQKRTKQVLDRVKERPKGWVSVRVGRDDQVVDGKTTLAEVLDVPSEEFRDIFVIRNSDLVMLNESASLGQLTERMLSLSTRDITDIEKEVRSREGLTEKTGTLSSAGGASSPGSQLQKARQLKKDIDKYLSQREGSSIAEKERSMITLGLKKDEMMSRVKTLERAELWGKLLNLESAIDGIDTILSEQDRIDRETQSRIEKLLGEHENQTESQAGLEHERSFFRKLCILGALGLGASACCAIILQESVFGVLQTALVLFYSLITLSLWIRCNERLSRFKATMTQILQTARQHGYEGFSEEESVKYLQDALVRAREADKILHGHISTVRLLLNLRGDTGYLIREGRKRAEAWRNQLGDGVVEAFDEEELNRCRSELDRIEQELNTARRTLEDHRNALNDFGKRASEILFDKYLEEPLGLEIDSIDSLKELSNRLGLLIERIERRCNAANRVISVLGKMKEEEEQKVAKLLSEGSRASSIFAEITHGHYTEVRYVPESRELRIIDRDGRSFSPDQLSKGTRDQLYLCIRVALGEKLLADDPGFFIMDDPFITSDLDRTEKQFQLLEDLVRNGWQIVFLTARLDLAEDLQQRFGTPLIKLSALR